MKLPNSLKIKQNKGHFAVQIHSRSAILVRIEKLYTTSYYRLILTFYLQQFRRYCISNWKITIFRYPSCVSTPPSRRSSPGTLCIKFFRGCQWMAKVLNGEEKWLKILTGWVRCMKFTDDRHTTDGTAIVYSELECEFTSAKMIVNVCYFR